MKIVTILGARPQFIKAGSVSREIAKHTQIREIIIHTGQHYDANMSDIFFEEMHLPKPHYNLGINGNSHGAMTGQMLEKIETVLLQEKPDCVMVYGDTNSTLAGALAAVKLNVPIAHIEAGLRSFNMQMPEEVNRILTDRISSLLFCPTDTSIKNLANEGFEHFNSKIIKSGDVMQDGALYYADFAQKPENLQLIQPYILVTLHRAENTDDNTRLQSIVSALNLISEEKTIVLPLHPRTKKVLASKSYKLNPRILVIEPVGYLQMVWLINNASLIMTDSGGLQKEAFFFRKPCVTLRDETEWVELIEHRFNVLAGADAQRIIKGVSGFDFNNAFHLNLYGGGQASRTIVTSILEAFA